MRMRFKGNVGILAALTRLAVTAHVAGPLQGNEDDAGQRGRSGGREVAEGAPGEAREGGRARLSRVESSERTVCVDSDQLTP